MAPEIVSAIHYPASADTLRSSMSGRRQALSTGRNVQLAQEQYQQSTQRTREARSDEQRAEEQLRAALDAERNAAQQVREAQAEHQQALRASQGRIQGDIINVLV